MPRPCARQASSSGHLSQGTPVFEAEPPRWERAEETTCPEADNEQLRKMIKQAECERHSVCVLLLSSQMEQAATIDTDTATGFGRRMLLETLTSTFV